MVLGGEASGPGHPSHSTRNWQSLDLRHVHLNPDIKLLKKSQLIYNVLISIVQQNDSVLYIYILIFFSIVVYHRLLNIVLCALTVRPCLSIL